MPTKKISITELNQKMSDLSISDEELAKYFTVNETQSDPFAPAVTFDPKNVVIPAAREAELRGEAGIGLANWLARMRRRLAFENRIGEGTYKGPVIVSEGDSWFQYPFVLSDVIDHLSRDFAILSLGAAGDTLENMIAEAEFLEPIGHYKASVFLISGGGNDLVGDGFLAEHLRDFDETLAPADYLLASFGELVATAIRQYDRIFRMVEKAYPAVNVFCHGYDRPVPRAKGKWLGAPMEKRGIVKLELQQAIAGLMIDRFNIELARLANTFGKVTYVDCRGVVTDKRWYDELHAINEGFGDVAAKFKAAITSAAKAAPRGAPAARGKARKPKTTKAPAVIAPARTAVSLHIGLNEVDPGHYAGWSGELAACEFDCEDMQAIADGRGFKSTSLVTKQATRDAVIDAMTAAAASLKAGDLFFVSYSGHGGQVPDFNADEDDALDETWCLYDGQLIDDELYVMWAAFAADVRILVVSDSCHSGSVIKAMTEDGGDAMMHRLDAEGYLVDHNDKRVRAMPRRQSAKVFRNNKAFYEKIGTSIIRADSSLLAKELIQPVAATVRLISGCQDNQYSYDGFENGQFTGTLLTVWNDGRFDGSYADFHTAICARMPVNQTPNHWVVGRPSASFDGQKPFEV
jgi:Caspase domain